MKKIMIASSNNGKIQEVQKILNNYEIEPIDRKIEVEEDQETFEKNAIKKAEKISKKLNGKLCIADDSGIEIEALEGFPGVKTKRWMSGTDRERNIAIINKMEGLPREKRKVKFTTAIAVSNGKKTISTIDSIEGYIALNPRGTNGFGFDEIFEIANGKTLAELTEEEKNNISSRRKALEKIKKQLNEFGNETQKGKLFVIDGTDGSGKQTQFLKLQERLKQDGISYKVVSFPNYDSPSSSLVKMYLSGEFGKNAKDVSPYIASTFYAADRYATFQTGYREYYEQGGIILADRYTTANMVHQAGKIYDKQERKKFLDWLWDFEFNLYGLPIPTEVFFLNMPIEKSLELIKNRENKFTHESKKDIHESDIGHLKDAYNAACDVSKEYNWYEVKCVKNDKIRTIEEIHEEIYNEVKKHIV